MFVDTKLKLNLSRERSSAPPWPTVLGLTLAVAALHGWLLAQGPASLGLGDREPLSSRVTLSTRSIVTAASEPAAAPAAKAGPASAPTPNPRSQSALAMQAPEEPLKGPPTEAPTQAPKEAPSAPPAAEQAPLATASASSAAAPVPVLAPPPALPPPSATAEAAERGDVPATPAVTSTAPSPAAGAPAAEHKLALAVPNSARLNYQIAGRARGFEYSASGMIDWQQDGQRYQARLVVSSFMLPSRSQNSVGEIGPDGLSPRRFSDRMRGEQAVHFQPELGRISFSANSPPVAWQPGAQDRLSLTLQLAAMLAGDPQRFSPGASVRILTASSRDVEPWEFKVIGSESLNLPIGTQTALRLKREPRRPYDQTIEIWFAPALGYLPVRIQLNHANGDLIDQRLASIERP